MSESLAAPVCTFGVKYTASRSRSDQVAKELGGRRHSGNVQGVARACAGDVEHVPLGVVHLLQIAVVGDVLNP